MARLSRSLTAVTHRASARSGRSPTAEVTVSKTRLGPPGGRSAGACGGRIRCARPRFVFSVRHQVRRAARVGRHRH